MNRQDILDKAVLGVFGQGCQAWNDICMYRDNSGNKCAIGHLIPDELYKPSMEESNISNNEEVRKVIEDLYDVFLSPKDIQFLDTLQVAHDTMKDMKEFIETCTRVANFYKLKMPIVLGVS